MLLEVTIGIPQPDKVDQIAVAASLPFGSVDVIVVRGCLDDKGMGVSEDIPLAVASVKAWLDTNGHPFSGLSSWLR